MPAKLPSWFARHPTLARIVLTLAGWAAISLFIAGASSFCQGCTRCGACPASASGAGTMGGVITLLYHAGATIRRIWRKTWRSLSEMHAGLWRCGHEQRCFHTR